MHVATSPLARPRLRVLAVAVAGVAASAAIVTAVRAIPEPRPRAVAPVRVIAVDEPLCGTGLAPPAANDTDTDTDTAGDAERAGATPPPVQLLLRRGDALLAVDRRGALTVELGGRIAADGRLTAQDLAALVAAAATDPGPSAAADDALIARGWIWIGDAWHRVRIGAGEARPVLRDLARQLVAIEPVARAARGQVFTD